jgi:hypothetical protein
MRTMVAVHGYGGICQETFICLMSEMAMGAHGDSITYICPAKDALLSRVRSTLLTIGLGEGVEPGSVEPSDCLIWVDHDVTWAPGDLIDLAERCRRTQGVVAALYPFRVKGAKGFPWRPLPQADGTMPEAWLGDDQLVPAEYVGGGFTAFWLPAVRAAIAKLCVSEDPSLKVSKCRGAGGVKWFWDICRPSSVPAPDGLCDYESEDWATCRRLRACGVPIHGWMRPKLGHIGEYAFTYEDALRP